MQQLTDEGRRVVDDVARRHGFSGDAVMTMLTAVSVGYGSQAQFNHPEFGGLGQWSSGGMIMLGDMFNNSLKGRVGSLCQELAGLIQEQPLFATPAQSQSQSQGAGRYGQTGVSFQQQGGGRGTVSSLFMPNSRLGSWWPADLGAAGSTGGQNNLRYAYFPGARRLAIDVNGQVKIYDTGEHQISGFSQQQSGDQSITFNSQFGVVRAADLPLVNTTNLKRADSAETPANGSMPEAPAFVPPSPLAPAHAMAISPIGDDALHRGYPDEIFSLIEKLADLHKKGILTDSEYKSKKDELLSRL